jgi:hypothetical protein
MALAGCGSRRPPDAPAVPEGSDACRISSGHSQSPETLTTVLSDPVDLAHVADPTNDSERFLFREIFETLIYLDCEGKVRPGLALAWSADASHRTWTFTMGGDSAEPELDPAAVAVVSTWRARPGVLEESGIESASALADGRLSVRFKTREDSVPRILANPSLGVAHSRGSILGRADRFLITRGRPRAVPTEFRVEPTGDPRDALDHGADLLITRDPAITDYVSSRSEFATTPLPWSLTYTLIQPPAAEPIHASIEADSVRRSMALDAVRADARSAEPPFWWDHTTRCNRPSGVSSAGSQSSLIVYPRDDRVAQGLAERIVALTGGGTALRARGLIPTELASAISAGAERAYVLPLPSRTLAPCRVLAAWPVNARIVPLIDTRASVILRRGSPDLTVDWDGTIRLVNPAGSGP